MSWVAISNFHWNLFCLFFAPSILLFFMRPEEESIVHAARVSCLFVENNTILHILLRLTRRSYYYVVDQQDEWTPSKNDSLHGDDPLPNRTVAAEFRPSILQKKRTTLVCGASRWLKNDCLLPLTLATHPHHTPPDASTQGRPSRP